MIHARRSCSLNWNCWFEKRLCLCYQLGNLHRIVYRHCHICILITFATSSWLFSVLSANRRGTHLIESSNKCTERCLQVAKWIKQRLFCASFSLIRQHMFASLVLNTRNWVRKPLWIWIFFFLCGYSLDSGNCFYISFFKVLKPNCG